MIYLDNAATTKVANEVISEMNNYHLNVFGNPASKHVFGKKVKSKINESKVVISNLINCDLSEIYFNSGSTEGINTVIKGYVEANIDLGQHIVTTKVEHKATLEACNYLESIGIEVSYLDVDVNGLLDLNDLKNALREDTLLVSILWANNETGVLQDVKSIGQIVANSQAKLFVDATQAVAKLPVDVKDLEIDMLCMSAHKFHGPKGVGALFIKNGIKINPLIYGGGQENGLRSGTSNTPGIVGMAKACEIAQFDLMKIQFIRDYLEANLLNSFDCEIIGVNVNRSPYITNVIIKGVDSDVVIGKLKNIIISTGSACNSEIMEPSHVLKSMGIPDEKGFGALRFSLSKYTTKEEIDSALEELVSVIKPQKVKLRVVKKTFNQ